MKVQQLFDDLRRSYLKDPDTNRFKDEVIRPWLHASLSTLYKKDKSAFYGRLDEKGLGDLSTLDMAALLNKDLDEIIAPQNWGALLNTIFAKSDVSNIRGTTNPNTAAARQTEMDRT